MTRFKSEDVLIALNFYLANISCVEAYKSWSDDFSREEVNEQLKNLRKYIKDKFIDFSEMTKEELLLFGFGIWKKEKENDMLLIPLHWFPCLKNGTIVFDINGEKHIVGKDKIDLDIRGGLLAFGIVPKKIEIKNEMKSNRLDKVV